MHFRKIRLASIARGTNMRAMSDDLVAKLAESIGQRGLLQPILVQQVDADGGGEDRFSLVSGHHRFLACKDILGWTEIDAAIVDADDLRTELVAIDENLIRNELGAADATRHHRRRKQIYEQLHPETKANVAGGRARQGSVAEVPSYVVDAAAATGRSERNVRRLLERANNLAIEELSLVAATCLDNGADLRRLNELSPEQRMPFIQSAHNGVRVVLPRSPKPVGAGKPIQAPAQLTDGDVLRAIVDHADIYLRRESDEASPSATGEALSMLEQGQWHQRPAVVARIGEALAEALLINVKESWTHQLSNAA